MRELNGYTDCNKEDIPDYREVRGQMKLSDSMYGWIPVNFETREIESSLCNIKLPFPLSQILALYHERENPFAVVYPAHVARKLDAVCGEELPNEYVLFIDKSYLKNIIDQVVNHVLEWTLKIEEQGIIGEGMQFS